MEVLTDYKSIMLLILQQYKEMPYLYDKRHPNYSNAEIKKQGFRALFEIYKNGIDKDATIKTMKKKLDNLRTTYVKELRKAKAATQLGKEYIPTLWYYDAFSFFEPLVECKGKVDQEILIVKGEESNSSEDDNTSHSIEPCEIPLKKQRFRDENPLENQVTAVTTSSRDPDDFEIIGRSIGIQLKDLNKRQLIITQKLIQDVIFYASFDRLTEETQIVLNE